MKNINRLTGLATACLLFLSASLSFARDVTPQAAVPGDWVLIGDIRAGRAFSRDALRLRGSHTDFRAVKFSVANSAIYLDSAAVTFDDGNTLTIGIGATIPAGAWTHEFDLPGGRRNIRRIEIRHQNAGSFRGPGVVSVFGLK